MVNKVPSIFIDRDGTLNVDRGYVYKIDNFKFIDGAIEALKELKKMGFALVLVTNQSGIGRGIFTKDLFMQLTEWMNYSLAQHHVDFYGIYFCPHLPDAKVKKYRQACDCRKPQPGMLLSAQKNLNIDIAASYMIGDKTEDMLAGKAAGVGTKVLVRSGKIVTSEGKAVADWVIDSLAALPRAIRNQSTFRSLQK
ncbi:D-glycero-beta-D-manno-heptose 1,7-bisphosphate 7-phosphatase [Pantoea sp. Nvir]|uniref:D-glycero-beta-D-manno-heptose 1,7-bisphosphate 7-phosphatase n=1 Tax=Pantoea sp. Nvir TaxID=2576760 RepID=UPI00135B23AE|nr:D-glycero-beta-D-manno-heptose 1,7-bisphosphate 7-phosphatase [Pantoea sp. Nvir]MXP66972.1 D-glycero-beta-D-manno-heptose 1,7-bisphosphate 7-phosphatase [Pantoea sp. Nvir]CAJ0992547.1 D-glycero-beta-D-manno-heptose-1,7-bisphosphate 7-phosphatase [Pantoea sp. Nvir]